MINDLLHHKSKTNADLVDQALNCAELLQKVVLGGNLSQEKKGYMIELDAMHSDNYTKAKKVEVKRELEQIFKK